MRQADAPLTKVTLNLYTSDHNFLKRYYGQGYSEEIRRIIHTEVKEMRTRQEEAGYD